MDMGPARKNPSSRHKTRLSVALHQPTRIPGNAYCDSVPNPWSHRSSSPISLPTNLWRLPTSSTWYNVCASFDLQFGVQQCSVDKQSSQLGIPNQEYSLSDLQRDGASCCHAHVLPVLRGPIQAPIRNSLGHWDYSRRRHDNRGVHRL